MNRQIVDGEPKAYVPTSDETKWQQINATVYQLVPNERGELVNRFSFHVQSNNRMLKPGEDEEIASFIIRAANNHEALLEELRHSALAVHTIGAYHHPSWVAFEDCQKEICISARKVLASVGQ